MRKSGLYGERNILGEAGWSSAALADRVSDRQPGHLGSRSANTTDLPPTSALPPPKCFALVADALSYHPVTTAKIATQIGPELGYVSPAPN
jgi:hypothetical protein